MSTDSIIITEGNYNSDNFVNKKLSRKRRFQTNVNYKCSGEACKNTWSSDYTTVEMLIQKNPIKKRVALLAGSSVGKHEDDEKHSCNVILRLYNQLCKECKLCGMPKLKDQHISPLIHRAADDILKFFNFDNEMMTN